MCIYLYVLLYMSVDKFIAYLLSPQISCMSNNGVVLWLSKGSKLTKKREVICTKLRDVVKTLTLGWGGGATSYPGHFSSAVGWPAKKALASAGLFNFATWLVNDFECNYSIYVEIIIILVEREWSDKLYN